MKYNLTTDLSTTELSAPFIPKKIEDEFYPPALYAEVCQTLDKDLKPPKKQSDIKYVYSRKIRPYSLFQYFFKRGLNIIGAGKLITTKIEADEIRGNIECGNLVNNDINIKNAEISSVHINDSIKTTQLDSLSAVITEISGTSVDKIENARFDTITATGTADMIAARAYWADAAELYDADDNYEPGTLVTFKGCNEITIASNEVVNAVVSEKPAVLLNSAIRKNLNAIPLVLIGKTKVKVIGAIKKFDRIELSDFPGISQKQTIRKSIGIALESNNNDSVKLVTCIVKLII